MSKYIVNQSNSDLPVWVTGMDLLDYPTPAELCGIALALKANLANNIEQPTQVVGIELRDTASQARSFNESVVEGGSK